MVTCPESYVKTNYHFSNHPTNSQTSFKAAISKVKSTGNLNPDSHRSTFTTLGFKKQTKAVGLKGKTILSIFTHSCIESMNRIFRRKNNVPVFDYTTSKL